MKTQNFRILLMLIALSLLTGLSAHADEVTPSFITEACFTKPQSPDAWAMTRYGEASLDLFHGTVGLTVPVYTYRDKDFTIPVSLSYASTGFMPGSSVGSAGQGWSLNVGGVITREVRGMPDDESTDYSWKWLDDPGHAEQTAVTDHHHYTEQLYGSRSTLTVFGFGKAYDTQSANLSDVLDVVYTGSFGEEFMAVRLDTLSNALHYFAIETQPDVFHFNFMGRSGSFILCPDGEVRVFDTNFPAGDISVEFAWSWEAPGNSSFILRTSDGIRYDFSLREDTSCVNQGYSGSETTSTSCWKLTRITAPSGRTAEFSYNAPHDRVSHGVSLNVDHRHTFYGSTHTRPWQDAEYLIEHPEVSDTYTTVQERSLSSITVDGCCTINITYAGAAGEYALQSITVRNGSNATVRTCSLTQSGSGTHRFLKGITIPGEGTHSFSYYSENAASDFPDLYTRAVDLYGYYTGSAAWTLITHGETDLEQYASSVQEARQFNPSCALMGMLQTVTWPTGGSTTIEYEQNGYGALMRPDNTLASDSAAAGLRVKSLTSTDSDGTTVKQKRNYAYETAGGRSSGVLLSKPELYWKYNYVQSWGQSVDREGVRSQSPLGFGLSSHIEYPRVVERITDGSQSSSGPVTVREFESTYGPVGNATSRERYTQQSTSSILETPQDGWSVTFTPVAVHIPESVFLSGGIHSGQCMLTRTESAQGLPTSKTETSYGEYPSGIASPFTTPMVYIGHLFDHEYHFRSSYASSSTETLYDLSGSEAKSDTVTSTVDDGGYLTATQTADSKGAVIRTEITYHPVCTGTPVRVSRKRGGRYVGGTRMEYTTLQNADGRTYLLPRKAYRAYSRPGITAESGLSYREVMSFDSYDSRDNLLQMTDSTGKVTGIVWDASGLYPVKVGEGMTYGQTASASSSSAGRLLTEYSWTPLVGLSSETDPSGRTTCYSYDSAGRLVGVTSPDGSLSAAWAYNTASDHTGYNVSGMYNGASLQLPQGRNWILSQTFDSSGAAASDVSYSDGLGFPLQDIAVRASGDEARDLVVPHAPDYLFREPKDYLPYPVQVLGGHGAGAFVSGAVSGQNGWYCSRYSLSGDACGYTESESEEAPGGRPLWSRRPGRTYYTAVRKQVFGYGSNTAADAVKRLDVGNGSGYIYVNGTYPAGALVKSSLTDEEGCALTTFTDNEGHTVLERRTSSSGSTLAETYYARDEYGRLCWVVQPEGSALLQSGHTYYRYPSGSDGASRAVKGYSFIYAYSDEDKVTEKNLAGTRDVEMTYTDGSGLLESFSDGNLASDGAQLVYSYDGLGRLTEERLSDGTPGPVREYFFDTYPSAMPADLSFSDVSGVTTSGNATLHQGGTAGLLTAERLAELDADGRTGRYAWRAHYYDILGNRIQTVTQFPNGVLLRESSRYDLRGSVLVSCTSMGSGESAESVSSSFTYDARGRQTMSNTLVNGSQISHVDYTYDDLGRPSSKTYGNGVTEALSYNIRGQRTGQQVSLGAASLFSTTLRYEDAFGSAGVPSWTGNISSWSWTQAGQGERSYVFGYDGLGRLTTTSQYLNSTLENKYGEDLVYDRNSNITSIVRRNDSSAGQSFSYSYSGNQRSAWEYDSNGNVTCTDVDADYPIYVSYNILNLPASVSHWDILSSEVLYLSDGTKIAVECDSGAGYHYYGPYRIQDADGSIEEVSVPGGRAVFSWRNGYMVRYTTADHLGSTRLVTDESGAVKEQYDYLPYGEKCINAGLSVAKLHKNNYLYTGKELQQYFDIDWYDSKARFQTTSGVFTSPDPLAEEYYPLSPYAYCAGDPVNRIDPKGNIWETAIDIASLVTGVKSFTANVKDGNVGGAIVDGIGIVLDVAAVVTPFAPGVAGAGISAIRAVDKGADALKVADKVTDAAKAADKAGDIAKNDRIQKLQDSAKIGQEAHRQIEKNLADNYGARTEVSISLNNGTKVRKDAQMPDGTLVIIKPDTPSGHRAAAKREKVMQNNGYKTKVIYYNPLNPSYRPGASTYIGPQKR